MDLQAGAESASATTELEVFLPTGATATDAAAVAATGAADPNSNGSDMVELTRYAARMLYAP
jgi:hypothetical protein